MKRLLHAVPERKTWEVGEAFAECVLRDHSDGEVYWPRNTVRDRRTPRASLPGADLVGFYREGEEVLLLIGGVQTSSDRHTPSRVMSGGCSMMWQLREIPAHPDIQWALLLAGDLIRDTTPSETDLRAQGAKLADHFDDPTRVELVAWYSSVPLATWRALAQGGA